VDDFLLSSERPFGQKLQSINELGVKKRGTKAGTLPTGKEKN
jgi:hypothetical protein